MVIEKGYKPFEQFPLGQSESIISLFSKYNVKQISPVDRKRLITYIQPEQEISSYGRNVVRKILGIRGGRVVKCYPDIQFVLDNNADEIQMKIDQYNEYVDKFNATLLPEKPKSRSTKDDDVRNFTQINLQLLDELQKSINQRGKYLSQLLHRWFDGPKTKEKWYTDAYKVLLCTECECVVKKGSGSRPMNDEDREKNEKKIKEMENLVNKKPNFDCTSGFCGMSSWKCFTCEERDSFYKMESKLQSLKKKTKIYTNWKACKCGREEKDSSSD